jgi:hypothetical protein
MKTMINRKALILSAILFFTQGAKAVVFEVTTAEEFQAALAVAATEGASSEIILGPGVYEGNFKYLATADASIKISSNQDLGIPVILARSGSFGMLFDGDNNELDVSLDRVEIVGAKSSTPGGGLIARNSTGAFEVTKVIVRDNYAPQGAGILVQSFGSVEISYSSFVGNASSEENYPEPGATVAVINTARLDLHNSVFELNLGGRLLRADLNFNGFGTEYRTIHVRENVFRDNSPIYNLVSISAANGKVISLNGNKFLNNSIISGRNAYSLIGINDSTSFIEITGNTVLDNDCFEGAEFEEPRKLIEAATSQNSLQFKYNYLKNNINCTGIQLENTNDYNDLDTELLIQGNLLDQNLKIIALNGTAAVNLLSNTFTGYSRPFELDISPMTEAYVVNNIFFSEAQIESIRLLENPRRSELRNNILGEVIGFWDVNEDNLRLDPKFHDSASGDFHLSADSPGIDAGTNLYAGDTSDLDLDRNPRVLGGTIDMGAFERSTSALHPADTNGDNAISQSEFEAYNEAWRTNEAWPTAPPAIPVDFVTRAGYLLQKGGAYKNIGVGKPATWVPIDE